MRRYGVSSIVSCACSCMRLSSSCRIEIPQTLHAHICSISLDPTWNAAACWLGTIPSSLPCKLWAAGWESSLHRTLWLPCGSPALLPDYAARLHALQAPATPQRMPTLFNPMGTYDSEAVLLVSLGDTAITLTAQQVTGMPWRQFVRLMKVSCSRSRRALLVTAGVSCLHASMQPLRQALRHAGSNSCLLVQGAARLE